jgi:HEAT repeat protein
MPADTARALEALGDAQPDVREAAAWTLDQLGAASPSAITALTRALSDSDQVVRGLAALGLRDSGRAAAPAMTELVDRLQDEEIGVRMIAAQAVGRLRDPSTIDALVAAARVPEQPVHVLRSIADALGEIGPQAARTLPLLNELARIPRVEWSAKAAIRKINGP